MCEDVQFKIKKTVLPIGQGFCPPESLEILSDPEEMKQIDTEVTKFYKSITNESRKSRAEKPFISKVAYILKQKKGSNPGVHELISLLADSTILFSRSYQQYAVDHEFFLMYKRMQGKSKNENLQFCRKRALEKVRENDRNRYEKILIQFQQKIDKEKWSYEKAEEIFVSQVIDREITAEEVGAYFKFCGNFFDNILGSEILRENYPELDLSDDVAAKFFRNYFEFLGKQNPHDYIYEYKRNLVFHFAPLLQISSQLYAALQDWIPNIDLSEGESADFVSQILSPYLFHCQDIDRAKEEMRHYHRNYRKGDTDACKEYVRKRNLLSACVERYQVWPAEDLRGVQDELLGYDISSGSSVKCSRDFEDIIEKICEATHTYFKNTRSKAEHFNTDFAKSVIRMIYSANTDLSTYPFRYLMICIAGTSQLFSSQRSLSSKRIKNTFEKPYDKKPSNARQRVHRIQFLSELNSICQLDIQLRSKNWNLFLQSHGSAIQSCEEADLWRKILYGECFDLSNALEDIPPVELALLCNNFLGSCLPVEKQFLYCYPGGCYIQEGGFAQFLEDHPNVLGTCVKRIKQSSQKWENPEQKYLKLWSSVPYDRKSIQQLCGQISGLIKWESISEASEQYLIKFFRTASDEENRADQKIKIDIENIRLLLIEASFRHILAEKAEKVLRKNISQVFKKKMFEIDLSKF